MLLFYALPSKGTAMALQGRMLLLPLFFLLAVSCVASLDVAANELSIVTHPSALRLASGKVVKDSLKFKPNTHLVCERIRIQGYSRCRSLKKYAHILKVKVEVETNPKIFSQNAEICFHRNASLGLGMCSPDKWEKLSKGLWAHSMSPFQDKFLDICIPGTTLEFFVVSTEEDLLMYRIIFLAVGTAMMTLAPAVSNSIIFYYGSAMGVGVILVLLMVLFQGMKLLPTGRKSSLAIFLYSSAVGVGTLILRYLSGLLRSFLVEMGIGEDIYYPVTVFFLLCLMLVGAWLGYWGVRKLVLCEDGSVDESVAYFMKWSIWIFSAVMILQSSLDILLAVQALVCCILISSMARRTLNPRFIYHVYRFWYKIFRKMVRRCRIKYLSDGSPSDFEYINGTQRLRSTARKHRKKPSPTYMCGTPVTGKCAFNIDSPIDGDEVSDSGSFYSTFHKTPVRKKFSKEEWEGFTKDSTKTALEELVSSPDFTRWAISNADRITLTPKTDERLGRKQRRWFHWF